ncbi:site-specific DNA-methyltransferase [archaeon]|nr:site-specific DNA-methyltransferase [archaeon]
MKNVIHLEDFKNIINEYEYDYIFTSPPDFEEIGTDPGNPEKYQEFLLDVFGRANPRKKIITVAFTDRKFNGTIVPKSSILKHSMLAIGYKLLSHKIWVKSTKIDMFRLTYGNVLTFGKGKVKQNMNKEFKPDVWLDGRGKYKKYPYGMPVDVPRKCILNYTQEGDIVYDPFMGSGTTAIAAIRTNRDYMGSELNSSYWKLCNDRISEETTNLDGFLDGNSYNKTTTNVARE